MSFTIAGLGTALPSHQVNQQEAAAYANEFLQTTPEQSRTLQALYRRAGVRTRHSVLLEAADGDNRQSFFHPATPASPMGPTTAVRMARYEKEAPALALAAARRALERSELSAREITHVITVSCSGFGAPGADIKLIKELGLRLTVSRTNVGFMGCHGAMNALRVADGFIGADPRAKVLIVAVELCSLHLHYGWNPEKMVANALFSDGAAAVVAVPQTDSEDRPWQLAASGAVLFPDSEDAMTWRIADHGFEMTLSSRVPELIAEHLRDWLVGWLDSVGLSLAEVGSWAIHPGGPRIVSAVARALGLSGDDTKMSLDVLGDCGNMSSPTILFILERLMANNSPRPCVALGFGPGLAAEAMLLR